MRSSYLDKYKGTVEKSTSDFKTKEKKKKTKITTENELFSREEFEDPEFAPTIVDLQEFRTETAEKERINRLNSKLSEKQAGWKVIQEPKKQRHDSSDEEKETQEKTEVEDFASRGRRRRNDTSEDESEKSENEQEPPPIQNKEKRHDSDSDLSPERPNKRKIENVNSPDLSPERRRPRRNDSDSDSDSPPRRRRNSPPQDSTRRLQVPTIVKKGENLSGLKTSEELDSHLSSIKEKEERTFAEMDPSVSGQFSQTVYRDKEGRKITQEEYEKLHNTRKKKDFVIQRDFEWNGGLVQKRNEELMEQQYLKQMSKPFATHEGEDSDYENELKEQIREGDPMAHLALKKKKKKKKRPEYEGAYPPNRYGIKPGYAWDGVNRSNGFEKKFFQAQSKMTVERSSDYQDF